MRPLSRLPIKSTRVPARRIPFPSSWKDGANLPLPGILETDSKNREREKIRFCRINPHLQTFYFDFFAKIRGEFLMSILFAIISRISMTGIVDRFVK